MIELLAPAGSREALIAAVEAGADAVYLSGNQFGARAYADNFDEQGLADAIRFAHLRGVHIHVTVNTMVLDDELDAVRDYLQFLERVGADAALVQDLGVAKLARECAPQLPLHASTQMTIHNLAGAQAMEALGFSRVVLSRELSLTEIRHIVENTNVEIEVFMHGALCVCYSGQCLMSSLIGGRSGNRGRCAQPCRLPYTLVDAAGEDVLGDSAGKFLLSPKDLNTIDLLPDLVAAGVSSLKIEGRMKKPEYVATVVRTYRSVLDRVIAHSSAPLSEGGRTAKRWGVSPARPDNQHDETPRGCEHVVATPEEHDRLAQIFNRDFTTAYLVGRPGRAMMSDRKPNNRGRFAGRVVTYDKTARRATLHLASELNTDDDLVIWVKVGGRVTSRVQDMQDATGRPIDHAEAGTDVTLHMANAVHPHDRVFKVYDVRLMTEAKRYYTSGAPIRRIPVDVTVTAPLGAPLTITMTDADGHTATAATAFHGEPAQKRPLTEDTIRKQVGRLGTSVFALRTLETHIDANVMFPVSEINKARQSVVEMLEQARLHDFDRTLKHENFEKEATSLLRQPPSPRGEGHEVAGGVAKVGRNLSNNFIIEGRTQVVPSTARPTNNTRPTFATPSTADAVPLPHGGRQRTRCQLLVSTDSLSQTRAILPYADAILFGGDSYHHAALTPAVYEQTATLVRDAGKMIAFNTPRIVRDEHLPQTLAVLDAAASLDVPVYVHNIGILRLARERGLAVCTDTSLVTANRETLAFFADEGVAAATLSPELTLEQVKALAAESPISVECLVHGPIELMVSEYCTLGSFVGTPKDSKAAKEAGGAAGKTGVPGCTMPCVRGKYQLRDRKGIDFPIVCDQFCHMHILNSRPLSMLPHVVALRDAGVAALRIEGRAYEAEELAKIVKNYRYVLGLSSEEVAEREEEIAELEGKNFTRGHYFRGVGNKD